MDPFKKQNLSPRAASKRPPAQDQAATHLRLEDIQKALYLELSLLDQLLDRHLRQDESADHDQKTR